MRLKEEIESESLHSLCNDCLNYLLLQIDIQTNILENQSEVYSRTSKLLKEKAQEFQDLDPISTHSDTINVFCQYLQKETTKH
jgi:hypothetical protein